MHISATYLESRSLYFQLYQRMDSQHIWKVGNLSSSAHQARLQVIRLSGSAPTVLDPIPLKIKQCNSYLNTGTFIQLTYHHQASLGFCSHVYFEVGRGQHLAAHHTIRSTGYRGYSHPFALTLQHSVLGAIHLPFLQSNHGHKG